ncbi:MAG: VOC family protein [Calditrichaeota bacterium]|nr:VOC family protein [Calditrichota bacterium]
MARKVSLSLRRREAGFSERVSTRPSILTSLGENLEQEPLEGEFTPEVDLGWLEICFSVKDLAKSTEFYARLGFEIVGGDPLEGWAVMENDAYRIALYEGHITGNMLNFRGVEVRELAAKLKERGVVFKSEPELEEDGSVGATIEDPDGNIIYLNTHPDELIDDCDEEECDNPEHHHHHHHHGH